MPSYFYHIALELLAGPQPCLRGEKSSGLRQDHSQTSLSLDSACEALLPFQKRQVDQKSSGRSARQNSERVHYSTSLDRDGSRPSGFHSQHTAPVAGSGRGSAHYYRQQTVVSPSQAYANSSTNASDFRKDLRLDEIVIECIDMVSPQQEATVSKRNANARKGNSDNNGDNDHTNGHHNPVATGIGTDILGGLRTKGRYIPLDQKTSESIWGIVHLYRDAQETPYLGSNSDDYPTSLTGSAAARQPSDRLGNASRWNQQDNTTSHHMEESSAHSLSLQQHKPEEDCTTLCILAVPSYLSPSDFLGFVGEKTLDDVSHFRMIKTARANRYMVLMKFRSGKKAREWQREWNGKVFNSMEPETCHVVFVKTVEIQAVGSETQSGTSPTQQVALGGPQASPSPQRATTTSTNPTASLPSATLSTRPLAPRTPALIELPTCPVCLERMDETTGLLTIICQHVFHCTCLQKWKGSGCPVCRYTQDDIRKNSPANAYAESGDGNGNDNGGITAECTVCRSESNLWICLICGNVGCGRYDLAHAFAHYKETAHAFAMDLTTQRVWDYVGDAYVHRIIQSKTDGKLVELPAADHSALDPPDWADAVPREKLENITVEYTHLLTSQLESQRAYFEDILERAADKASQASAAASSAQNAAESAQTTTSALRGQHDKLTHETVPGLERDKARAEKRAEKFESMARKLEKEWREEKTMNESLMERITFLSGRVEALEMSNRDLEEQNRDLSFFISGSERLKGVDEDVVQGTVTLPEAGGSGSGNRRKGKGKKK